MPHQSVPDGRSHFARQLRHNQTTTEARLWHELRAHRLDGWKFKRQVLLEGYIVDFVCHEARLVVEVDGPLHRKPEQTLHDKERDAALRKQGFRVIRFSDETALGRMIEDIRRALTVTPLPTPD